MLFKFLKYLQPTHYFTLNQENGTSIFPKINQVDDAIKSQLRFDDRFESKIATEYDASWQALNKGYVGSSERLNDIESIPLIDEYRFARKYFSRVWVAYTFLMRVLSFNNPIKEFICWRKSRKVKRSDYLDDPIQHEEWTNFQSSLIAMNPKISVIIPTLNRYPYLKDVLKDLKAQSYKNFEVFVVDQSEPFDRDFYDQFDLDLKVEYQKEKALWLARNSAIKASKNDLFLLYDDDSRVDSDWIHNHLKCLDFFSADISSGVSISAVGAEVPKHYSFFRVSDQLDTGNVLIKRKVFEKIGLFDRQFEKQRMGDGEFGLRAFQFGFLNVSNPHAKRLHLKVGSGGLRQMGSWDAFRTKRIFDPRPIPSVLYFFRRYFGNNRAKWALLRNVPMSIMPYQLKKNKPLMIVGVFISILILPLILIQVWRSWSMASRKLNQGPLIESLQSH